MKKGEKRKRILSRDIPRAEPTSTRVLASASTENTALRKRRIRQTTHSRKASARLELRDRSTRSRRPRPRPGWQLGRTHADTHTLHREDTNPPRRVGGAAPGSNRKS